VPTNVLSNLSKYASQVEISASKVTSEAQVHSIPNAVLRRVLMMVNHFRDGPIILSKTSIIGIAGVQEPIVASMNMRWNYHLSIQNRCPRTK
jgi:hypothetical protein